MTESEPTLSSKHYSDCCAGPGSYCPIGQLWVIGRFLNRKFNVSIKAGHGPSHSSDFNHGCGCSHQPGHPCQEFHIPSAGASRTRAFATRSSALYQLSYGTGYLLRRLPTFRKALSTERQIIDSD